MTHLSATSSSEALALMQAKYDAAHLPELFESLFAWLNANLPKKAGKQFQASDIAHIGLTAEEMAQLPGEATWDSWYRCHIKHYQGIALWQRDYNLPALNSCADLRRRIAWKLTDNTVMLFHPRKD